MKIFEGTTSFRIEEKTAVAIGKFDGIHRGHKELLKNILDAKNRGLKAAVFTFDVSPENFFKKIKRKELTTREEKRARFEKMGIDYLVEYPFNEVTAKMLPENFVKDILLNGMNGAFIVAGCDLSFGHMGKGNAELLNQMSKEYGFETKIIPKICDGEKEISSSYVRSEVRLGHMEKAEELLGEPYSVSGIVMTGNKFGRKMGLPTLNLYPSEEKLLPPNGVYFARTSLDGKEYNGVVNIGCKPTVGVSQQISVETNLFGFNGDAYGKFCEVRLLKFDREEQKFENVTLLKQAILQNIVNAKEFFVKNM